MVEEHRDNIPILAKGELTSNRDEAPRVEESPRADLALALSLALPRSLRITLTRLQVSKKPENTSHQTSSPNSSTEQSATASLSA
jgi:hypothetical protein